jgi:hypothetical protein
MDVPSKGRGKIGVGEDSSERVRPPAIRTPPRRPAALLPEPLTLKRDARSEGVRLHCDPPLKPVLSGKGSRTPAVVLQLLTGSHTLRQIFANSWLDLYGFDAPENLGDEHVGVIARIFHLAVLGRSAFRPNLVAPRDKSSAIDVLEHFLKSDLEWAAKSDRSAPKERKTRARAQTVLAINYAVGVTHAADAGSLLVVVSLEELGDGGVGGALQERASDNAGDKPAAPVLLVNVGGAARRDLKVEHDLTIPRASGTDKYVLRGILSRRGPTYRASLKARGSWYTYDGSTCTEVTSEPTSVPTPALLLFDAVPRPIASMGGVRGKPGGRKRASDEPLDKGSG